MVWRQCFRDLLLCILFCKLVKPHHIQLHTFDFNKLQSDYQFPFHSNTILSIKESIPP